MGKWVSERRRRPNDTVRPGVIRLASRGSGACGERPWAVRLHQTLASLSIGHSV